MMNCTENNMDNLVLITGGLGYLGSHCVAALESQGHRTLVIDNLSNSSANTLNKLKKVTGKDIQFVQGDICNQQFLHKIFESNSVSSVIHFAGLKSVEESIKNPELYRKNNIEGTKNLLNSMERYGCKKIIFSSSATVYGNQKEMPIKESATLMPPMNPYGASKLKVEEILDKKYQKDKDWSIINLRYFNPIGAHPSGLIGEENSSRLASNLMPIILEVAAKKRDHLKVFGNDYDTPDGTAIRDYIHVMDLIDGHCKALQIIKKQNMFLNINLGTGKGYSVLEIIHAFEQVTGVNIPIVYDNRRAGDSEICIADPTLASSVLNWDASHNLNEMCLSSWQFYKAKIK